MNPVLKKAGALALSLGTLGALVTHAAITGCKPTTESASPTAVKETAEAVSAAPPAASTSVVARSEPSGAAAPTPITAKPGAAPTGGATLAIEEPEWLPASKAGPVFRPKSTPKPQSTTPVGKPQ